MEKVIVFFLSVLIFFSPVFSGTGNNQEVGGAEVLLQSEGFPIRLSFEHYKMQDGWTPVVLSLGELDCLLWIDESGRVLELRESDADFIEPVCVIDVSTKTLRKEAEALYFDVYEQNSMRTRWRLSPDKTAGTVAKKISFREKSGIDLCLGTLRLPLKHVAWDLKEFSPGLFHVQLHGPMMAGRLPLVYEKATGMIYSTQEWDTRLILEQNRTQASKPAAAAIAAIPPQERAALIALYNSTDGDNWFHKSGWKTPPLAGDGFGLPGTENSWYGITCDTGNTTVKSIYLYENNLNGNLPPELGKLYNLKSFIIWANQLCGPIPPELGNLANLQILTLDMNQLSGNIPPELGNLANLRELDLWRNQISGIIPPELGNLANLINLRLRSNQFSGTIPSELGNLTNLQYLDLCGNLLSGNIPPELGNLLNLKSFSLDSNQLSGSIPPELGNLVNLQYLSLDSNQLSGNIPLELGNLNNLIGVYLSWNQFSGTIPPGLGNLANLKSIHLGHNQLSGSIPSELGKLANLQWLLLGWDQISGTIPPELGNLTNLKYLYIGSTQLSGSIPSELGNLINLQVLWLGWNHLSGSIPPQLGNLINLNWIRLNSNRLSGSIPPELVNMVNLNWLDCSGNALYTNDDILRAFLNSKQWDWESTQTIAPSNVTATAVSPSSIELHWTPITYISNTGGYRIFYSTTPGGPYTYFGMTENKTASSLTVTGLNPGTTYYFVIQTRTNPHVNNQNTVDSEFSAEVSSIPFPLILTSPNGGESWGLRTIQNITWTSSGLSGNIRLELWKADKKLGNIAANIPISSGNYTWFVGNYGPGVASPGNDYKIKIITANGLYNDASNAAFSIIQPSLTLTSPHGNENWKLGTQQNITWTSAGLSGNVKLLLFKGGGQVGVIARGIPITNGSYVWTVGKYSGGVATAGSNYTVKIRSEDNPFYSSGSGVFTLQ